jgi:hypothetical protein
MCNLGVGNFDAYAIDGKLVIEPKEDVVFGEFRDYYDF